MHVRQPKSFNSGLWTIAGAITVTLAGSAYLKRSQADDGNAPQSEPAADSGLVRNRADAELALFEVSLVGQGDGPLPAGTKLKEPSNPTHYMAPLPDTAKWVKLVARPKRGAKPSIEQVSARSEVLDPKGKRWPFEIREAPDGVYVLIPRGYKEAPSHLTIKAAPAQQFISQSAVPMRSWQIALPRPRPVIPKIKRPDTAAAFGVTFSAQSSLNQYGVWDTTVSMVGQPQYKGALEVTQVATTYGRCTSNCEVANFRHWPRRGGPRPVFNRYPDSIESLRLQVKLLRPVRVKQRVSLAGLEIENRFGQPFLSARKPLRAQLAGGVTLALHPSDPPALRAAKRIKRTSTLHLDWTGSIASGTIQLLAPKPEELGLNFVLEGFSGIQVKTRKGTFPPTAPIRFGPIDPVVLDVDLAAYEQVSVREIDLPVVRKDGPEAAKASRPLGG
jgi:hypothetical protein